MKQLTQLFIIQLLMVFVSINAFSQAGTLDSTFATNGKYVYDNGFNDVFHCTAIQDDQKIIAAGVSYDEVYTATAKVFRFMPDGSIDTDFATDGVFSYSLNNEANLNDVVIKDNGKIILVGSTTDYTNYKILLLQLNDDGTLDNTFGTNGVVVQKISPASGPFEDFGYAVTLQSDGKILVAGRSDDLSYNGVPVVVRFNENGELDTTFGTDGVAGITVTGIDNVFDCIALQEDGKIVVAGHYELGLQYFGMLVARFNSDGTLDDSFADDGVFIESFGDVDDEGYDVAINSDGKIIVTGFSGTAEFTYSMLLMQLDSDGNLWSATGKDNNGIATLYRCSSSSISSSSDTWGASRCCSSCPGSCSVIIPDRGRSSCSTSGWLQSDPFCAGLLSSATILQHGSSAGGIRSFSS